MKKIFIFLVISLISVNCFAKSKKSSSRRTKKTEVVVNKHPGQMRNTKVWNWIDCEFIDSIYKFASVPEQGVNKIVALDTCGNLKCAFSVVTYSNGNCIKHFKDYDIEFFIIDGDKSKLTVDETKNEEGYYYATIEIGNYHLGLYKETEYDKYSIGGIFKNDKLIEDFDFDHEYRNSKEVWRVYNQLKDKFNKLYTVYRSERYSSDCEIDKYIDIAKDDFQFYISKGYLQHAHKKVEVVKPVETKNVQPVIEVQKPIEQKPVIIEEKVNNNSNEYSLAA